MNYTPDEAAERIGISKATLAFWRTKGDGPPFFYAGRHVKYREAAIAKWEEEQEAEQTAKMQARQSRASA